MEDCSANAEDPFHTRRMPFGAVLRCRTNVGRGFFRVLHSSYRRLTASCRHRSRICSPAQWSGLGDGLATIVFSKSFIVHEMEGLRSERFAEVRWTHFISFEWASRLTASKLGCRTDQHRIWACLAGEWDRRGGRNAMESLVRQRSGSSWGGVGRCKGPGGWVRPAFQRFRRCFSEGNWPREALT